MKRETKVSFFYCKKDKGIKMKIINLQIGILLMSTLFVACSSTPKGSYSRSHIDRPYALPDDVASFEFGAVTRAFETKDVSNESTVDDDTYGSSTPTLIFEHGISDNVSWIYPLGVKWNIFNNEKHTFGVKLASFIIYNTYSIDYWYRLSKNISLRPYFLNEQLTTFFYNERKDLYGIETLYQLNSNLALNFSYGIGTFEGYSPFLDAIVEDITGSEQEDFVLEGSLVRFKLGSIYSISELWDVRGSLAFETIKLDEFTNDISTFDLSFVYLY
jgi:hypothetical protein